MMVQRDLLSVTPRILQFTTRIPPFMRDFVWKPAALVSFHPSAHSGDAVVIECNTISPLDAVRCMCTKYMQRSEHLLNLCWGYVTIGVCDITSYRGCSNAASFARSKICLFFLWSLRSRISNTAPLKLEEGDQLVIVLWYSWLCIWSDWLKSRNKWQRCQVNGQLSQVPCKVFHGHLCSLCVKDLFSLTHTYFVLFSPDAATVLFFWTAGAWVMFESYSL